MSRWCQFRLVAIVWVATALIIWWPLDFSLSAVHSLPERLVGLGSSWVPEGRDVVLNVLVLVPLGIFAHCSRLQLASVGSLALAVSLILEAGQVFQPGRIISPLDVVLNVGGAVAGALLARNGRSALRRVGDTGVSPPLTTLCGVVLAAGVFAWSQHEFGGLSGWPGEYTLQIGNEATGDRPWCGKISSLSMQAADRLWTEDSFALAKHPLPLPSGTSHCPRDFWLMTTDPASDLVRAVRRSGRLRLSLSAQTGIRNQHGPARIVSLSSDPANRNITVAQEGEDLIVRIRRRWAGTNGDRPFYKIYSVFSEDRPVEILVDAGSDSTIVTAAGQSLTDRHDVATQWWYLLVHAYEWREGTQALPLAFAFWLVVLGPVGLLAGALAAGQARGVLTSIVLCGGAALASGIVLRVLNVEVGWESLVSMPAAIVLCAELARRLSLTGEPRLETRKLPGNTGLGAVHKGHRDDG
jgi:glycopeptide antibiotics resistance protein